MNVSRIMAPRRLEGGKRYAACLVPAFDVGVARGLGDTPPLDGTMGPAWRLDTTSDVRLPVYFHWEFATGPAGDFEELARRLKPFVAPETVGVQRMYIGNAGPELPSIPATDPTAFLDMDGALRAPKRSSGTLADVPAAMQTALRATLDALAVQATSGPTATTPVLGPPLYGEWHAKQHTIPDDLPAWLRELNLDPRARARRGPRRGDRAPESGRLHAVVLGAGGPHPRCEPSAEPRPPVARGTHADSRQTPGDATARPARAGRGGAA